MKYTNLYVILADGSWLKFDDVKFDIIIDELFIYATDEVHRIPLNKVKAVTKDILL